MKTVSNRRSRAVSATARSPMNKPHRGYFRVQEQALRQISETFDRPCDIRNATACYVMFCRKANLKGSFRFEDSIGSIAADLSMAYRDAQKALALVEATGLVKIKRRKVPGTKENAHSIYTLVWVGADSFPGGSRKDGVNDESRTVPKNYPKNSTNNGGVPISFSRDRQREMRRTEKSQACQAEGIDLPTWPSRAK